MKGRYDGSANPFHSKKHTPEARARMSAGRRRYFANGGKHWARGKAIESRAGRNNPMFGRSCAIPHKYLLTCRANGLPELKIRSRWEARIAMLLDFFGATWRYEPDRFDCGPFTYCPDFYVNEWNVYLEVKGRYLAIERLEACQRIHPNTKIVLIDEPAYRSLMTMFEDHLRGSVVKVLSHTSPNFEISDSPEAHP